MGRPVCLFTGQWADLPLEKLAAKAQRWGFDGLELACWGDHFEVDKALADPGYCQSRWEILNRHKLKCFAISAHLVGQAVCDLNIDQRHKGILPPEIWGDGKAEGVRQRAAQRMMDTARAAAKIGLTLALAFVLAPLATVPPGLTIFSGAGLLAALEEVLIGVSLGLIVQL